MRRDHALRLIRKQAEATTVSRARFVAEQYANCSNLSVTKADIRALYDSARAVGK